MGIKSTGGYSIQVTKVTEGQDTVTVYVKETTPKPGQRVTMALTAPYRIVKTQKITKPVVFVKE